MKFFLATVLLAFSTFAYSQEMKIRWEDDMGREFEISAPSGNFSYGMLSGDDVHYDWKGRVDKVGDVRVHYDWKERVDEVGDVRVHYDHNDRLDGVGSLSINYDYKGRISGTSGSVN
jgi:hypothetical protein